MEWLCIIWSPLRPLIMAPRRRCPTCGSKQWHKEPSSGMIACSEGHVLQVNYRNETTEITEVGPHAMKKRALKSRRKVKGQSSHADPKLYHGARGRYHYFQCLQLLLRKQIAALTTLWELPPEFEVICRDIWALNLALLPDPPPAEPYHHAHDDPSAQDGDECGLEAKQDSEHGGSDEEEKLEADEEEDSELEALMRENSEISSSSDDEMPHAGAGLRYRKGRGRVAYESPMSTIAVLVVACWTMRIPVLYCDFTSIIESYELPYLDAVMQLPRNMAQHLTKHNVQALSPPHAPRTMAVHSLASRLAKKLWVNYGICTPEANGATMLWRITKYMGGTRRKH
ncbi:hypothetical protein CPB84DRAFT_1758069 [Gymnopilus junonius]|uniref:Rrn7/TAF1B N-terminal cyclin domain-containing protein n=1 Tax=Gymnopilus junonius TaxID=109634 RepID=A0A9P5TTU4_GYMJU|nr:hypothetical protein CPB84DRAFT_1758069 [Gymnopilus junonius]